MSQKNVPWSFAFGLVAGPLIVALLLAPRLIDLLLPGLGGGFKAIILILGVITLLWSMLQSLNQAMYIFGWSLIIAVAVVAFEIDRMLPASPLAPQSVAHNTAPIAIDTVRTPQRKIVDKSRDFLQYSTFDAKEKTPIPTATPTPNTTPLFDLSSLTAKDQSIGTLPKRAFFGGSSGKSSSGGIMSWYSYFVSYITGR